MTGVYDVHNPTATKGTSDMSDTVWHPPTPHTVDDRGSDVHPAFGMISAARVSGGPSVLFDSDITHNHTVRLTVSGARRRRDLHRDWIIDDSRPLIEVEMSEAQWASFVSSLNTSGVPCTVRRTQNDANIDGLEYDPRLAHTMDEVKGKATTTFRAIRTAMDAYDALDARATAKDRRAALDKIRSAVRNAESNVHFAASSLTEHAEDVVQRARADIEAMVTQKAAQLGLTAGQAAGLVELPAMPAAPVALPPMSQEREQ